VIRALADDEPQTALLADDRTIFVAAFDGESPVGFAFGYVLPRRRGKPTIFFVYEVDVDERYRRQGIGKRLMENLLAGQERAFVLTDAENQAANALYASVGGTPHRDVVEWNF
jgi:aminoglycoside 3-N-acetyltransferase I